MPRKLARKTKFDREKEKEAVKTLYAQGESLADAARAVGVTETVARQWAFKGGWKAQVTHAEQLAQKYKQNVTPLQNIVFDRVLTGRETRNSWARTSLKVAQHVESLSPEEVYMTAPLYKAHVEASAKIDGTWESTDGNRFAIAVNLNQMVTSGQIQPVPAGCQVIEADGTVVD